MSTEIEYSVSKRRPRASAGEQIVVHTSAPRTRMSMGPGTSVMQRTNVMSSRGFVPARPSGEVAALSKKSVQNVKETRNKEKGDLSGLNQKLADQMETYRYLQGMVKQCQMETEKWKKMRMFDESKLKELIADEINDLRKDVDKEKEKNARLEAEKLSLCEKYDTQSHDIDTLKKNYDDLLGENEKLKNINVGLESEALLLRKDMEFKDAEIKRRKEHEADLMDDVERLRHDLELAHEEQIRATQRLHELEDELAFLESTLKAEIAEYQKMIKHMQNAEPDYSRMWTGQFKESIQKLQEETDQRINQHMAEMQLSYDTKLAKIQANMKRDEPDGITRTQTNTLKSQISDRERQISDLNADIEKLKRRLKEKDEEFERQCDECEQEKAALRAEIDKERCEKDDIEKEMQDLEADNLTLSQEIATYASLLNTGTREIGPLQGNYQSLGGAMLGQSILGGGGGGAGGYGSGSGSGSGGGMSSSQQSNPPRTDPVKKQGPPVDKAPKKKPENAMSESSGRMTITKTSKIGITIDELSFDGGFVRIVNTASKDIDLSKMKLQRTYYSGREKNVSTYTFKSGHLLKRGEKLTIFSARFEDDKKENDLVANAKECKTWGTGTGEMKLLDSSGNDVATYNMKMSS